MMTKLSTILAGALTLGQPALTMAAPAWAATDFDGDGRADLAFHHPDGTWNGVPLLRSNGDGSWTAQSGLAPSWANEPGTVAVAGDYNGDGRTDVAFHNPQGSWKIVPVLLSNGAGGWSTASYPAPSWANQLGAVAIGGDFNGDGRADLAFHHPDGSWASVPVLLSNGNGSWLATNYATPSWANQAGVIAVAGDYDGDGRTDLAFYRPGGSDWTTVPVLLSNGNGSFTAKAYAAPSWSRQTGVVAIGGDFDKDGRADLAFHRPGSSWTTVPMLRSGGDGSWVASNLTAPSWANQPGATAIAGDYNGDGRADLAFHRPDGVWTSVPVLLSLGGGAFSASNTTAPSWANQPGVTAIAGDYNLDGRTDLAFQRPDGKWTSVPVLLSNGNGSFTAKNYATPAWANQALTAVIGPRHGLSLAHPQTVADGGDAAYDQDAAEQSAWNHAVESWMNFLRLFVRIVLGYDEYVRQSGLNGDYDGSVGNGTSSATAFLHLEQQGSEVHGRLIVKEATVRLDGGICSDVVVPVSVLPVTASSSTAYHAVGTTSRPVSILGVFSGTVDIAFDLTLETSQYTRLTGTMDLDVPWPCANQSLSFAFWRRPLL